MAVLTDSGVQEKLLEGETYLRNAIDPYSIEATRLRLILNFIATVRVYSKSGNAIPGLRGLGLKTALRLCEEALEHRPIDDRQVSIHNYSRLETAKITPGRKHAEIKSTPRKKDSRDLQKELDKARSDAAWAQFSDRQGGA